LSGHRARTGRWLACTALERRPLGYRSSVAEDEPAVMYEGHMISVLSGGRKRRRRHYMLAPPLWVAAAAFAGFVSAALVLVRI
jgi:hypothetical protein